MSVTGHGDEKYRTGRRLTATVEWSALRIECWRHEAGQLNDLYLNCTEVAVMLAGQVNVRRTGDGEFQEAFGRPGTSWICPAGITETNIELSAPMEEVVHIFIPATLMEETALATYEIDPARAKLGYAGGLDDPLLVQIGANFRKRPGSLARGAIRAKGVALSRQNQRAWCSCRNDRRGLGGGRERWRSGVKAQQTRQQECAAA